MTVMYTRLLWIYVNDNFSTSFKYSCPNVVGWPVDYQLARVCCEKKGQSVSCRNGLLGQLHNIGLPTATWNLHCATYSIAYRMFSTDAWIINQPSGVGIVVQFMGKIRPFKQTQCS